MKMDSNISIFVGFRRISLMAILLLSLGNVSTTAQEIIYKKDSTQVEAVRLEKAGKIISYKLLTDTAGIVHYISTDAIDSILYEDGKIETFQANPFFPEKEEKHEKLLKNSVGINVWPLLNTKFNIYYERLFLNNRLGFKNYFLIDAGSQFESYGSLNQMAEFYYNVGLNYYYLQSYFFSVGTGVSVLTGKFWRPTGTEWFKSYSNHTGIILNTLVRYFIHKKFSTSVGIQIPLGFDFTEHAIIIQTEISFNF